jgi:flagellar biosynthesis/type III secretory pathway protein FliH
MAKSALVAMEAINMSEFVVMKKALRGITVETRPAPPRRPAPTVAAPPAMEEDQLQALRARHRKELEEACTEARLEGEAKAANDYAKQLAEVRQLAQKTLKTLATKEEALLHEVERMLPELVMAALEQVLSGWKPSAAEIEQQVRNLLEPLRGEEGPLRVFLAPVDHSAIAGLFDDLRKEFPQTELNEDPQLRSGECYVQGRFGITDGRFAAKLRNLRSVLS